MSSDGTGKMRIVVPSNYVDQTEKVKEKERTQDEFDLAFQKLIGEYDES